MMNNPIAIEITSECINTMKAIAAECSKYQQPEDMPEEIAIAQSRQASSLIRSISSLLFGYDEKHFDTLTAKQFVDEISMMREDVYKALAAAGIRYKVYAAGGHVHGELSFEQANVSAVVPLSIHYGEEVHRLIYKMDWRLGSVH